MGRISVSRVIGASCIGIDLNVIGLFVEDAESCPHIVATDFESLSLTEVSCTWMLHFALCPPIILVVSHCRMPPPLLSSAVTKLSKSAGATCADAFIHGAYLKARERCAVM